jgi:hypothetical protein
MATSAADGEARREATMEDGGAIGPAAVGDGDGVGVADPDEKVYERNRLIPTFEFCRLCNTLWG